jgi:hypothetical protein
LPHFSPRSPSRAVRVGVQSLVFESAPIQVDRYAVARDVQLVQSPAEDGYVVGMKADVVDLNGNVVPDSDVMLHHVVFTKLGAPDSTCSSVIGYDGKSSPAITQRFYAEGEEHFSLQLPDGYGYPNLATDRWGLLYMLMNHHAKTETVRIRYTVACATREARTPVTPIWLDVRNCRADPIFNVPGTGGPGSTYAQQADWVAPQSGVFVAGGAHLHGGEISVDVSDTSCGSILTSYPIWGGTEPQPVMHEPGPVAMTGFSDPLGRPVRTGDTLRITATYDDSEPHVRVMGIAILYFAPRPETSCEPFASPLPVPTQPEKVTVALLKQPRGPRIPSLRGGKTFSFHFTRPGTYRLFCSLHPAR